MNRYTKADLEQIVYKQLENLNAMNDLLSNIKRQNELSHNSQEETIQSETTFNSKEEEFLSSIRFHGPSALINSLKRVHDLALYHSDLSFSKEEKSALFDLKILWESLEKMK